MAGRLQEAKRAAASRGELRTPLPVGYLHDETGDVVIDPDAEVQAAVAAVFTAFTACGSAYGVVAAFAGRRFPLRAYGGAWAGQLRWGRLTHARVLGVLKNPAYAGAYVFGRYASRRSVDEGGRVHAALVQRPRSEWPVLIKDHHEGYITWTDYLANEAKLAANHTAAGARPPREGSALCQGIIYCGSCGKPMMTNYHTDQRPAYECSSRRDRLTTPSCRSVAAACVDAEVARALLDALTPEQVTLALSAAGQVTDRHQRVSRAAELAVERARYEADRAERSFCQVEPENRLVARTLEARWETKLAALAEAEQSLETARDTRPPLPSQADLEKLASDLPALWHAPTTSAKDRKRLLRTLIADVTMLPEPDRSKVRIGIRWHTGAVDKHILARPLPPGPAKRSPTPAVQLIARLGPVTDTRKLAEQLNAAGLTTGHGRPFDDAAVQWIRHAYKIPHQIHTPPAKSASQRPPAGSAAAPASSTTGSRPGSCTPVAGPATGSASPGPTMPRPNAGPASPNPGTSPPRPAAASPASEAEHARNVGAARHHVIHRSLTSTSPHTTRNPTRGCRGGSMNYPSRPWPTGSPRR